jgi:hypothetical protein
MMGRLLMLGAVVTTLGCGNSTAETGLLPGSSKTATANAFTGSWNSVTPSYEFIRLSVVSKSVEQGSLGTRLTLSGVAFDGTARIDADSLIATMSVAGSTTTDATLIARAKDSNTLIAHFRSGDGTGTPLSLTFVRQ